MSSQLDYHRARVRANARLQSILQRKLSAPQILDSGRYRAERGRNVYSPSGYEVGRWVEPSRRDTNMKMRYDLLRNQRDFIQGTRRETA